MRALFLVYADYPWRSGGVNQSLDNLMRFLGAQGHEVDVVSLPNFTGRAEPVFPAALSVSVRSAPAPLLALRSLPIVSGPAVAATILGFPNSAVREAMSLTRPDVVVADFTCALAAGGFAESIGVPLVVLRWAHWAEEISGESRSLGLLGGVWRRREREVLNQVQCLVVDGPDLEDDALASGVEPERVALIPSAVKVADYADAALGDALRQEFGLTHELIVLFPSMLRDIKGFDHLLRAFALLPDELRARTRVVATGRGEQAPYRQLARELGVQGRVLFRGEVAANELVGWFIAADVAAFPYKFGAGLSVAGVESLAAGVPLVAYDVQSFSTILQNGMNGRLVPLGDVEAFSAALAGVLGDDEVRAHMSAQARRDADAYDIATVGGRFERLLESAVKGDPCGL